MTSRRLLAGRLALLSCLVFAGGCDLKGCRADNSSGLDPQASLETLPEPTFGNVSVAGIVSFEGTVPEPRIVGVGEYCGDVPDTTLVVNDDNGLKNVLVYLDGAPASTGAGRETAELDQQGCLFVPRTLGVQVGQPFEIVNGDPTRHNVRFNPDRNERQNLVFATGGERESVVFDRPESDAFGVKCDIHPWMAANVRVFDHPFYATTDESGRYEIGRVPAGDYELVAWHELLGERREPVMVADAGVVAADVVFARN